MQEWLPAAPPAGPPHGQQVPGVGDGTVAGLVRIERANRRELAVHRRRTDMRRRGLQHRDPAGPPRRGKLQPRDELPDVLQPGLTPVQGTEAQELPVIPSDHASTPSPCNARDRR
jgi:hypothetical protein